MELGLWELWWTPEFHLDGLWNVRKGWYVTPEVINHKTTTSLVAQIYFD